MERYRITGTNEVECETYSQLGNTILTELLVLL
jgi:hypothetical protein